MQVTDKEYIQHQVFAELAQYVEFYDRLATAVFLFPTLGTKSIGNIDTYVYASMKGTIESIKTILITGRINDAYALLRKYYDSVIINIYSNLYLQDHFDLENFIVEKIHDWLHGKESLPGVGDMAKYIEGSEKVRPITTLLYADDRYKRLRSRCNDHMHYNFFRYVMLNDNEVYIENRGWWLDRLAADIRNIFILNLSYIFFLNWHYMMSSDYMDAHECGMQPEEGAQYCVAPFIQDTFNDIVSLHRADITAAIKANSPMQLL